MSTATVFKGVTDIGKPLASDTLEANLCEYFNWGFLCIGGFFNVTIPTSGAYDGDFSTLRLVDDPHYTLGQVWEGARQDWVWETGVEYAIGPIHVSGVYVNSVFSNPSGSYPHHVNYPLGRVVFDTALPTTSVVKCNYSYRYVHVESADADWTQNIHFNSFRVDDSHFNQLSSGVWANLAQSRVQLPAIIIEAIPRSAKVGYELGGIAHKTLQDVHFHILTESKWDRKQLHDIVTYQQDKTILSFDKSRMLDEDRFPLNSEGTPVSGFLTYPQLVQPSGDGGYFWKKIFFSRMFGETYHSREPLHYSLVRASCELLTP